MAICEKISTILDNQTYFPDNYDLINNLHLLLSFYLNEFGLHFLVADCIAMCHESWVLETFGQKVHWRIRMGSSLYILFNINYNLILFRLKLHELYSSPTNNETEIAIQGVPVIKSYLLVGVLGQPFLPNSVMVGKFHLFPKTRAKTTIKRVHERS